MKHCMVKDCDYPVKARSLCQMHYWYWWAGKLDVAAPEAMTHQESGAIGGAAKNPNKGFGGDRQLAKRASVLGHEARRRKASSHA